MTTGERTGTGSPLRLVVQGSLATAVCFGFCRFSVGLLLEPMRQEFDLSYTAAGVLASVNLASYVVGALVTPMLGRRVGYGPLMNLGLLLGTAALAALALSPTVSIVAVALAVAGFAAALAWIAAAALGTARFAPARRGVLMGIISGATGAGMVVAALIALTVVDGGEVAWRRAWGIQAVAALIATVAVGRVRSGAARSAAGGRSARPRLGSVRRGLLRYYGAYAGFAAGYILFVTYIVAAASGSAGDYRLGASLWLLAGIGAAPGAVLIGAWSDRFSRNRTLTAAQLIAAAACLAVLADLSGAAIGARLAAVVVGAIMTGMGTLMPSLLADELPAAQVPDIFASFTLVFAIVQSVAPIGGGVLIDATSGFTAVFLAAAGAFAAAALGFRARRRPVADQATPK